MARRRILAVEDDPETLEAYRGFLGVRHKAEFDVWVAREGESALEKIRRDGFDLVILDRGLPDMEGLEVLRAVRADPALRNLFIFVVTARGETEERVRALEEGADDYLVKPVDLRELVARLRSLFRRREYALEEKGFYEHKGLRFEPSSGRLAIGAKPVRLFPKEEALLQVFLRRPNMVHSAAHLWDEIWGYETQTWRHVLEAKISSLRRKLGPVWGPRLEARKGTGYMLVTDQL